jgi:hypothetical protein
MLNRLGQDIDSNNLRLFYFVTHVLIPAQTQTFLVEEAEDFCHLVTFLVKQISVKKSLLILLMVKSLDSNRDWYHKLKARIIPLLMHSFKLLIYNVTGNIGNTALPVLPRDYR